MKSIFHAVAPPLRFKKQRLGKIRSLDLIFTEIFITVKRTATLSLSDRDTHTQSPIIWYLIWLVGCSVSKSERGSKQKCSILFPTYLLGITFTVRLYIYWFQHLLIQILVYVVFVSSFSLIFIIIFCSYICPFVFLSFNFCFMVPRQKMKY